ncbi:hypothetical protein [Streptomyces sp. NRRL S-495]|uniref:hypothetical protein n=1 Tax=Streptomyces sp. NRRL S-495 TaxID=1609133 RepID=UPI002570D706|nr:hypothetical protein [Streptomyces sp. NRRL S-495]
MVEPLTVKPSIARKCMVQMPQPISAAPSSSQPSRLRGGRSRARTVQRRPSAAPVQATR